jgi:ATP-binding cassette subfamily G (WHITE) protein 2 (SNQ2)
MLDVIGAGATATSEQNWYDIWKAAPESVAIQEEVDKIHTEGRSRPAVTTELHSEFATPWFYQAWQLLKRDAEAHWRDPTYIMAKLVLNAVGGLFIGFTFFKAKDSQQGTQNKLFVSPFCVVAWVCEVPNVDFIRRSLWLLF